MIRPERHHTYRRVLAALDSFLDDEINAELNRHILDLASSQAVRDDAERTLDQVDCDILAVKPKGFVTPLRLPDQG